MSIRNINKDHLKEHAGVNLVNLDLLALPDHKDPLKFWTHHEKENMLVDLTVFAEGTIESPPTNGAQGVPFTGRPQLIRQLAPAIEAVCVGAARLSVRHTRSALRAWWRLFDAVEHMAANVGQPMDRVEDVRQLTRVHLDFVHRSRMRNTAFHCFFRVAKATLKFHGASSLYWDAPEDPEPKRHLPPENHVKALRIALKQEWEVVRRGWALQEQVRADGFEPQTDKESKLLKHWQHFAQVQGSSGKALPSSDELRDGIASKLFAQSTGFGIAEIRRSAFPGGWEAETAFHLCLANTGWNPAVLYSLDASQPVLLTHPRDPSRYLLIGTKTRAGGKVQPVNGLWKTTAGPGYIIRSWLERIAPLRGQLKTMLTAERTRYVQMKQDLASPVEQTRQLKSIQRLENGYRSVWLYVDAVGEIAWLNSLNTRNFTCRGKDVSYLVILLDRLNRERAAHNETSILQVTASDFRDIFALYVWRMSGGNILALMRALNHAHLRTTQNYTENNILNAERDHQARTFLDHLFDELGAGRVDIAILAHLQRHGAVTKKMEERLADYRALPLSRMAVACKNPSHPPTDIQPKSANKQMCGPQRCLLCKTHAVILPESMRGIAMRVEELAAMQTVLPVGIWLESRFPEELRNGLDVLRLFPSEDARKARDNWAQAIANGSHHIPGLHLVNIQREIA